MQGVVDMVNTVAGTYLSGIRLLILGAIVIVIIVVLFLGYATPAVVEEVGERAESISEKAIDAAREEQRATALAGEGWGYSGSSDSSEGSITSETVDTYDESYGEPAEGWGEATE